MNGIKIEYKKRKAELKKEYRQNLKDLKGEYSQSAELYRVKKQRENEKISAEESSQTLKKRGFAPRRSLLEEIGNAVSHGIGSLFAICAFTLMMISAVTARQKIAACVYGGGMLIMFTMSCLYHSFRFGSTAKRVFRRFDYLSIYLLIGATFAPLLLCYTDNDFGLIFFIVQWAIIAAGITLVAVFGPARLRFIHIPLYFILGWSALVLIPNMIIAKDFELLFWILGGGILYTVGIIPFAVDKKVAHFIWHIFVLFGAIVQWLGIYLCIYAVN